MVAAADPSWQLSHRSAVSGLELFNYALLVTFGSLGLAFGAGTTPKYQTVPGPDPLAISGRLRQISGRYYSPDTARNYSSQPKRAVRFSVPEDGHLLIGLSRQITAYFSGCRRSL